MIFPFSLFKLYVHGSINFLKFLLYFFVSSDVQKKSNLLRKQLQTCMSECNNHIGFDAVRLLMFVHSLP